MVHLKVAEAPAANPVTPEVGDAGVVTVAVPDTTDHAPVPLVGVLPARVAVVPHTDWSAPALAVGAAVLTMTTSSVDGVQPEPLIVHLKVTEPTTKPVTPDVGLVGVVTVAAPVTTVHAPVPLVGVLPASVAVAAHTDWSGPAADAVKPPLTVMTTSSVDEVHDPLAIVHLNVFAPTPNPVTPDVALPGVVIVAVPDTTVHVPVPLVAVLPASVAVEAQTVWSGPAAAVVGAADLVITTSSVDGVHPAPLIVHLKVAEPTTKPVTPDVGLVGVVTVAVPDTTVHEPVPLVGVLPANVAIVAHTVW
jgi:hypothetical protein